MSNEDKKKILAAVEDLVFLPNPEHRRVKSAFWAIADETQLVDPSSDVALSTAMQLTGDGRLQRWWALPGFREWFANREEFRQRVEYLANLALDTAEEILLDKTANAAARANMVKLMVEVANKMPPRQISKEIYVDEKIQKMDRAQLEEYVRKNMRLLSNGTDK